MLVHVKNINLDIFTLTSGFSRCPLPVVPTFNRSTTNVTFVAFIVHHGINQMEVTHFHCILHLTRVWTRNYNVHSIRVKFVLYVHVLLLLNNRDFRPQPISRRSSSFVFKVKLIFCVMVIQVWNICKWRMNSLHTKNMPIVYRMI